MIRLVTALLICALPLAPAAASDLSADEIRDEIIGHSLVWWEADGWSAGSLVLTPDGRAEITVDQPRTSADLGAWTFSGDQICTTWESLRAGTPKCYRIERDGNGRFLTSGGNIFEVRDAGV